MLAVVQGDTALKGWLAPALNHMYSAHTGLLVAPAKQQQQQQPWHPGSSNVATLLGRSTVQACSDGDRLRLLALPATSRRFTEQAQPSRAWDASDDSLSGRLVEHEESRGSLQVPLGSVAQPQGSFKQPRSSLMQPQTSSPKPGGSLTQPRVSLPQALEQSSVLKPRSTWQTPLGSFKLAQGSFKQPHDSLMHPQGMQGKAGYNWLDPNISLHQPRKHQMLLSDNGKAYPTETDTWPGSDLYAQSNKKPISRSFSSETLGAPQLQVYRVAANLSQPSLSSNHASDRVAVDAPANRRQPDRSSFLISSRWSEQPNTDWAPKQVGSSVGSARASLQLGYAEQQSSQQQQQGVNGVQSSDLFSAVSVQPRRLNTSFMAAAATAELTRADAAMGDQAAYSVSEHQVVSLPAKASQIRQSPVAAAVSDSPWNGQQGRLHLRHQNTWHLPTAVQLPVEQQQPFGQRPTLLQPTEHDSSLESDGFHCAGHQLQSGETWPEVDAVHSASGSRTESVARNVSESCQHEQCVSEDTLLDPQQPKGLGLQTDACSDAEHAMQQMLLHDASKSMLLAVAGRDALAFPPLHTSEDALADRLLMSDKVKERGSGSLSARTGEEQTVASEASATPTQLNSGIDSTILRVTQTVGSSENSNTRSLTLCSVVSEYYPITLDAIM